MHPIDETNVLYTPEISLDDLRSLLSDLRPDWRLVTDDSTLVLVVDGDDEPRGYIDVALQRLAILDGLSSRDTESSTDLAF